MAFTGITNLLKEYQNSPVLQRGAFRNKGMDRADGRAATGLLASSPELINAVVQNQMPMSATSTNFMGFNQQPDASTVDPIAIPVMPEDGGPVADPEENPVVRSRELLLPKRKPSTTATEPLVNKEKTAEDPPKKESTGSKADAALKSFTDKLSELRGTKSSKTKKDRLKEAKEFLKEAGVSDVDDIRTSKDFMLMTLGLNIAAGQSGDFLTNVAGGAKETLGTFGELKAKEKESERAINLAAAEMAKADADAAIARGAKLDEAELAMLTKQYETSLGPDDLQIARVVAAENNISVLDALKQIKGSKSQTASSIILASIQADFPNIKGYFLRQLNTAGGLKYIGENFTEAAIADGLGVDISTPEGKREVDVFMGIARNAPPASLDQIVTPDGEQNNNAEGGDGIKIEAM